MNKDNTNSQINQACHQRKLINRRQRRQKAYGMFTQHPDLKELKNALTRSLRGEKKILYSLLRLIMQFKRYNIPLYASEEWIANKIGCNIKSLSRVIGQASDMGVIHVKQRGFNGTNEYFLNPAFNKPSVQHSLSYFFSFLKVLALHLLLSCASHHNLDAQLVTFNTTDVTLIKNGTYINSFCGSVESCDAKRSEGVPRKERRRVKDRGETESFYWSRGEKIAREGLEYDVDPRDMCTNNGSIECLFVQGNALLEATSESFDNREYVTSWERDMSIPAPYLTDEEEWEEIYDPPVGDDYPQLPETEPDIFYPDTSDEEIAVSDSDDEVELAFEHMKIQIESFVPMVPVDTGERLISNPNKPWNAPAWRKVASQADVETFTEFINRVTKKKGNYD